jgi:hypothetical protein
VFETYIAETGLPEAAAFTAPSPLGPHSVAQRIASGADLGRWATADPEGWC